jgi:dynein heavy chain 1
LILFYLGKSTAWRVLLTVLNRLEGSDGQAHVIDPKAISKDDLYGSLDQNTRMLLVSSLAI